MEAQEKVELVQGGESVVKEELEVVREGKLVVQEEVQVVPGGLIVVQEEVVGIVGSAGSRLGHGRTPGRPRSGCCGKSSGRSGGRCMAGTWWIVYGKVPDRWCMAGTW